MLFAGTVILGFGLKFETYEALADALLLTDMTVYISCLSVYVPFERSTYYYYYT
jgi:hypothetical protein